MKISPILACIMALTVLFLPACHKHNDPKDLEHHTIVVTSPRAMDVVITQQYVCQIHSKRHIKVRALQSGYLESIPVNEGQEVKEGQVLFKVIPILYKTKLDAEQAEAKLAELELNNTRRLYDQTPPVVSIQEVALYEAKLAKAQAKAEQAKAELNFTEVKAAFRGIIDRQEEQHGGLVKEGDVLTTLSDNSLMWVYYNVPEAQYLHDMADMLGPKFKGKDLQTRLNAFTAEMNRQARIELVLANGDRFKTETGEIITGKVGAIGTKFNNENGNVSLRADFPNPDHLLRHGMTGTILIHRTLHNAVVIPQRATFEILDKQYVYVVGKDDVVHQREIKIQNELEDIFVIESGLAVGDTVVYEGIRQVHDGEKVEFEFRPVEQILERLKFHAE